MLLLCLKGTVKQNLRPRVAPVGILNGVHLCRVPYTLKVFTYLFVSNVPIPLFTYKVIYYLCVLKIVSSEN